MAIPDIIKRCISYLKPIKRPAAKRLIEDLKQNKICYPDGTFMKKIFSD
jgi:hypothetical protein